VLLENIYSGFNKVQPDIELLAKRQNKDKRQPLGWREKLLFNLAEAPPPEKYLLKVVRSCHSATLTPTNT